MQTALTVSVIIPIAAGTDAFVRRPSEAVESFIDGLGGPSYGISKRAILSREWYSRQHGDWPTVAQR